MSTPRLRSVALFIRASAPFGADIMRLKKSMARQATSQFQSYNDGSEGKFVQNKPILMRDGLVDEMKQKKKKKLKTKLTTTGND